MRSFLSTDKGNDKKQQAVHKAGRSVLSKILNPNDDEQEFDFVSIKNAGTINRILNQMHYAHTKLNIHHESSDELITFYSTIAKVNRKAHQIIIHQPKPLGWQKIINPGDLVEVSCFMPSGQISFFSKLTNVDESRDNYYCLLSLPEEISKFQLRSSYRVFMPPGSCNVEVMLSDSQGLPHVFEGVGLDLSTEGCCLRFIGDPYALLDEDQIMKNIEFNILSGRIHFKTDAEIRRLAPMKGGQIVAGVKFRSLPTHIIKRLQSALIEIQRIQLRQQVQMY